VPIVHSNAVISLWSSGGELFLGEDIYISMFFYLHCCRVFNCLHVRRMKNVNYYLCGNPQNNFGPHKTRKNLGMEAVNWKSVAKVGEALLRLSCLEMRNIYPRRCPNPLRFLVFDSQTADEHISHKKTHDALRKTVAQLLG